MKRISYIFLFLLFFPLWGAGADWNNFIIHYSKNLYGKGSQTWQIAPYDDSWAYFANKKGMLQFDGAAWELFPLKNGIDVRSVHPSVSNKRIYAGGINEFGYFEPDSNGRLTYTCLSDSMSGQERFMGNIWEIHENDNILYLQGDGKVVKCLNGKYTFIDMEYKIDCSGMVNGVLYVGTDHGVYVLVGNTFFSLQKAEILQNKRIRKILPYQKGALIVTAYDGLFYYNGNSVQSLQTGVENFMAQNEVFSAAILQDQLALGTVHKGLVLINLHTLSVKYFNENNGLQNNTVLSLSFDKWGNLWAGLDSGIDYVWLTSPYTNLYSYPYSYGTGYAAALYDGLLYLGTNRGLYYIPYPVKLSENLPDIKAVSNSSGQVWGLNQIGDELFCMHDRGMFVVKGATMQKIGEISGAWTCQLVVGQSDKMYVGVYDGLFLLEKRNGVWTVVNKVQGLFDSCRYFAQETDRIIWICANDLIRIELDEKLSKVINLKKYGIAQGMPADMNFRVGKVEDKVYITTSKGIYQFNPSTDRIEPSASMNKKLNGNVPYSCLTEFNNSLISLSPREICVANLRNYKKGTDTNTIPIEASQMELVQRAEAVVPISDSLMVIPNENGFALLKVPARKHEQGFGHRLHIRKVYLSYPKDSLIYIDNFLLKKNKPEIAYYNNAIRLEYGVASFISNDEVVYQYRLNSKEWSDYTDARIKEYSNLHEGNYTFEVKALFPDGTSSQDSFQFRILPPWYRTGVAYGCYFLLFMLGVWLVYRWDDLRVKRKKLQIVLEKDKELKAMEKEYAEEKARQERQIVELEKEKLEYELKHKSQEMANLMINFVRKNEILTEIKADLLKVSYALKGEGAKESKQMLLVVSNKIDSNIQSDEVLKRIEEQFDLVHNNFMKCLREKHPDLSNNERMMCAYLKMNLSTKEIAPLLNISIRGVETIRYRLRKKFDLEREDSLTDYLASIH